MSEKVTTSKIHAPELFNTNPDARYATVILGKGLYPESVNRNVFQSYLQMRARTYISEQGFLSDEFRRSDDTEIDADDERARHLAIVHNLGNGAVIVEACLRLIEKTDDTALPIERHFNDSFTEVQPVGAVEVSRWISRIDDRRDRARSSMELFTTGLAVTLRNNLGPVFGIIEDSAEHRLIDRFGIPLRRVAPPTYVEEYHTNNFGIEIDVPAMEHAIGSEALADYETRDGAINYWKERQ